MSASASSRLLPVGALALVVALALLDLARLPRAEAHEYAVGALRIVHPWTRATAPGQPIAGGFMVIENTGPTPDRLIGGTFPLAGTFEVHEMSLDGGIMKMRQLEKGLEIAPGQKVELKPGGYHLMFMGLKDTISEGARIKGTLVFEKAGTIEIEYKIEPIGARASGGGHGGGHGGGDGSGGGHGAGHKKPSGG